MERGGCGGGGVGLGGSWVGVVVPACAGMTVLGRGDDGWGARGMMG